ncbi:tripartite tricarboxylate transporter permease [Arthrobacter castelli]|uniref:tripartite tricarboxylate transporter permease n=1 Tax=Arthrobacter castelli TaxID=271431 RepID=UPI000409984D|nr:tripartite tricarboxylate transporter permease [Arthrobacter castelli]
MDALVNLLDGFTNAFTLANLFYAFLGTLVGSAIGVLPGIGPAMSVALLLPLTYGLDPTAALIMFAGIYYGSMYGGSTAAIILNTPGESGSIATALEGNKMAKAGRGAAALATAAIGSFVAGTIATLLLALLAPSVAEIAVMLGPQDYFALMILAFLAVTAVLGSSLVRGLASLSIGLAIGLIGIDVQTGQARFTLGIPQLYDGVDVILVVVGLFAVGEAFWVASRLRKAPPKLATVHGHWMRKNDFKRSWKPWLRGTALGFPIGAMPAGGAEIPTFLSYGIERKLSKHSEEFGTTGAIEGVAGPEAANNASAAGVFVPLLTLGLPTSATAAILLAAFQQFGLQPGPAFFTTNSTLVWTLLASLLIGNAMLLALNLPLAGLWARLLRIPRPYLYAGIMLFATFGVYSLGLSPTDLFLLLIVGLMGYAMRSFGWPVAPAIIAVILGPLAEQQVRRALAINEGDPSILWSTPFSLTVLLLSGTLLIGPFVFRKLRKRHTTSTDDHSEHSETPRSAHERAK